MSSILCGTSSNGSSPGHPTSATGENVSVNKTSPFALQFLKIVELTIPILIKSETAN